MSSDKADGGVWVFEEDKDDEDELPHPLSAKNARAIVDQMTIRFYARELLPILEKIKAEAESGRGFANFRAKDLPASLVVVLQAPLGYRVVMLDTATVRVIW